MFRLSSFLLSLSLSLSFCMEIRHWIGSIPFSSPPPHLTISPPPIEYKYRIYIHIVYSILYILLLLYIHYLCSSSSWSSRDVVDNKLIPFHKYHNCIKYSCRYDTGKTNTRINIKVGWITKKQSNT